jgi:hypothetical protein
MIDSHATLALQMAATEKGHQVLLPIYVREGRSRKRYKAGFINGLGDVIVPPITLTPSAMAWHPSGKETFGWRSTERASWSSRHSPKGRLLSPKDWLHSVWEIRWA